MQKMADARPALTKRATDLLAQRYDLSGNTDPSLRMSGGKKPVPVGPTARLKGISWDELAALAAGDIKKRGIFPYAPLVHPLEPDGGGMVFPPSQLRSHRLLTLEDTVEFFNLVLGTKLAAAEKRDLVAYLRVL